MKIIKITSSTPYPPLQKWDGQFPPDGWAEFPEKFVPVFYPSDKLAAGFVDITEEDVAHSINGDPSDNIVYPTVTDCVWNEEAYQAYISSIPEQEPDTPPTTEERVAALEAENKTLKAQVSAQSEQMDFYEECIAEMASVVYA